MFAVKMLWLKTRIARFGVVALMVAVVFGLLALMPMEASAESVLAVAQTQPGWDPAHVGKVFLFKFKKNDELVPLPPIPAGLTNDPSHLAFSPGGELFVANRHGNVLNGVGSVSRFLIDMDGNYIPNGKITGNSLEAVHGLAFSPEGELFAANLANGKISRFVFASDGTAQANGTITTGLTQNNGLVFSPEGELFVSGYYSDGKGVVKRYLLDPVTYNGQFYVAASSPSSAVGMAFDNNGEFFVAVAHMDHVKRFIFDEYGSPTDNGEIVVGENSRPFGVAFDSAGELFVATHNIGGIYRFIFNQYGEEIPNGTYSDEDTDHLGGAAIYAPGVCDIE